MFLAIDIGNTHTTLGLLDDGGKPVREWRVTTQATRTADELYTALAYLPGLDAARPGEWKGAAVCSVVPRATNAFVKVIEEIAGVEPLVLRWDMDLGVPIETETPREVGMDRLANAVAGVESYGPGLVVVDFGTATTLDIVSAGGAYAGGVILPGIEATADALYRRTAQLPQLRLRRPDTALGKTTVDAMLSGLYFGSIHAVEGCIARIEAELGTELKVIATGGLSRVLGPDMGRLHAVDAHLTLRGIHQIWKRNTPA